MLAVLATALLLVLIAVPAPAAAITITVPYSTTPVADSDLDGNPATGSWSDANYWTVPLENGAASPYGSATLYAKHDGTYIYLRIDGKIDVPWTSASGNHFWLGMEISPTGTSHHGGSGSWDGVFFGESAYTPAPSYPPLAVDTNGFSKPPAKDTTQNDFGKMGFSGSSAPYSFTAEWKRPLTSGDSQDVALVADGTTAYNFFATTDSDGGGSSGGNIDHSKTTDLNTMRLTAPSSGDTTPPTVSLTSPANGALVGGAVGMTAAANDNVGVTKVEFYVDAALKGTVTTSPYSYSWDTTLGGDGSHALLAKAYDAASNVGTSATVTVTVDNTRPVVAITAPTAGAYLKGVKAVSASASDANGVMQVNFYLDGGLLATDSTSPYSASWDTSTATEAAHLLTATAADAVGNLGTSAAVSVTVDRTAPVADAGPARLVSPGATISLDGSGSSDSNGIANYTWTFTDGTPKTLFLATPSYTFNNLGNFLITLTVADPAGNTAAGTTWVNVTADTQPPVAKAGPAQSVLQGTLVTLDGSLSTDDVGIANYTWTFTDVTPQTLWGAVVTYRFLHVGNFQATLVVMDFASKTGSARTWVNVSADTVPPVARAGPDRVVDQGSLVSFDGTLSTDNVGIANYTWTFTDGTAVTLYGPTTSHRFSTPADVLITLTVRDYAGNSNPDTAWVNISADQVPPIAVIEVFPSPSINILQSITLNGTKSSDNVGVVNYTWNLQDAGPVVLYGSNVSYRFHQGGNRTVTLTATDLAGNSGTAASWLNVSAMSVHAAPGPDRTIVLGSAVLLDGSASTGNGGIANYTWRVEGTAVVLYGAIGNYTPTSGGSQVVNLSVRDAADLSGSGTFLLTVVAPDRTAPAALDAPSVVEAGAGALRVSWSASTAADLAGYLVLRSASLNGPFIQLNLAPLTSTSYVDEGLEPGQTYYYEVIVVDLSGNASPPSPDANGIAGLAPPAGFDVMSVRWALVPGATGAAMVVLALMARQESRRRKVPPPPRAEGNP